MTIYYKKDNIIHEKTNHSVFVGNSKELELENIDQYDLRAVSNFMVLDKSYFNTLKPTHYFLVDPLFFRSKKQNFKSFWSEINSINFKMKLVVPALYFNSAKLLCHNNNIEIQSICLSPIKGPNGFITYFSKKGFGSFKIKNVLGAFLIYCIRGNHRKIDLFGVNHDWSRYMYLNRDKILCLSSESHNSKKISSGTIWFKNENSPWKVPEAYYSLYEAFKFYEVYSSFLKKNNFIINNKSQNSLIQNF